MEKSDLCFKYPVNLNMLDLATLVNMYRSRGIPSKPEPGGFFCCPVTHRLVKEAKNWFSIHYSQAGWDLLLTPGCNGYPLTSVEFNIMGVIHSLPKSEVNREKLESSCGVVGQLAHIIINDLRAFGFIEEDEHGHFELSMDGDKALQGFAKRVYEKRFSPEMLLIKRTNIAEPKIDKARKANEDQISLF
jgi:hypothetical protein